MRFMMIVKANKDSEAGLPPNPELMAAVEKLAEEARQRGVMIDAGGLLPSAQGSRIRVSRGKTALIDGPFAETKELVGGLCDFRPEIEGGSSPDGDSLYAGPRRHFRTVLRG